jgi:hypothetical protein
LYDTPKIDDDIDDDGGGDDDDDDDDYDDDDILEYCVARFREAWPRVRKVVESSYYKIEREIFN